MRTQKPETYTVGEYVKAILLFILITAVITTVGALINERFNDSPTCADYAKYGLEGSDYCAEEPYK